ncbi:MAG: DUF5677 domain-containing protein [Bryobacterales bacterium]|nr:DUF5677 domain-containing protein [Bryobacterales bacterium]
MSLVEAISQAKDLSDWLHTKINEKNFSVVERDDWGVALLQHSWDVADAIIILLERDLPGPAWTLARPLCESFVRGVWILHCASDKQVENFRKGEPPKFSLLLKAMDNHNEAKLHAAWIRAQMQNKDVFHDFTHGGIEHVLRRIDKNVVEPHYSEHELEYLVGLGTEVYIRVGCELFTLMNETEATRQLCEKVQASLKRPALV